MCLSLNEIKVNIINTRCILISEAVTVPCLMMIASIVSEESLARDTHTQTDNVLAIVNFCKVA